MAKKIRRDKIFQLGEKPQKKGEGTGGLEQVKIRRFFSHACVKRRKIWSKYKFRSRGVPIVRKTG